MEKILKTCHPQFVGENDLQVATASIHAVCEFITGKAERIHSPSIWGAVALANVYVLVLLLLEQVKVRRRSPIWFDCKNDIQFTASRTSNPSSRYHKMKFQIKKQMLLPGYKSWRMRNTKNIVLLAKRKEIHQFSQSFIYSMTRISLSSAGLFPFPFFFFSIRSESPLQNDKVQNQ